MYKQTDEQFAREVTAVSNSFYRQYAALVMQADDYATDKLLSERIHKAAVYFADHLGVSCLSKYSSAFMGETLMQVAFFESQGQKDKSLAHLADYIANMRKCLELISDTSIPLFEEMQKWVKKFSMCCDLLDAIYDAKKDPFDKTKESLSVMLEKYNSNAVLLTGFCLREAAEKTLKY